MLEKYRNRNGKIFIDNNNDSDNPLTSCRTYEAKKKINRCFIVNTYVFKLRRYIHY